MYFPLDKQQVFETTSKVSLPAYSAQNKKALNIVMKCLKAGTVESDRRLIS
jgi:hypothetical protein